MYKELGEPLTTQQGDPNAPMLSMSEHMFEVVGGALGCSRCLRQAKTAERFRVLFNSCCLGSPNIGDGHRIVRWGPAGICELCGHYSLNIQKYVKKLRESCPGAPSNKSTLANVRSHVKAITGGREPKTGRPIQAPDQREQDQQAEAAAPSSPVLLSRVSAALRLEESANDGRDGGAAVDVVVDGGEGSGSD